MKRKITDNIPLKIMSLAVAVLVWLIVVNIDNPMETQYYTVSNVEIINKDYIESPETGGKMCLPEVDQGSIRVAITAQRKVQSRISASDITATADLQQAISLDTTPVMVPITATCPGVSAEDIMLVQFRIGRVRQLQGDFVSVFAVLSDKRVLPLHLYGEVLGKHRLDAVNE